MFKTGLVSAILGVTLASATNRPGDLALSAPYALKAAAPFLLLPTALDDGDDVLLVDLLLFGALTVPNSLTLYHAWSGHAPQTAFWRKTTFVVDLAAAVGIAGYALHGLATLDNDGPGGFEGLGMSLVLLSSIPVGLVALLDLIPFSTEHAHLSASPLLVPGDSGVEAGALAALRITF
jgi:hypothetical protein